MKFMVSWTPIAGNINVTIGKFLAGEATPPEGVTNLGRWHGADLSGGFTLCETNDAALLYKTCSVWADLMDINIVPVIEDAEAAPILSSIYKK